MKLHGQYSNKLKRLNKNKAKHSRSHESTGVDNTDRQNIMTDLLRHNGLAFCVPWRDFFNKADDVCCCSFDVIFGLLFQSSCTILCHSITWFSPVSRLWVKLNAYNSFHYMYKFANFFISSPQTLGIWRWLPVNELLYLCLKIQCTWFNLSSKDNASYHSVWFPLSVNTGTAYNKTFIYRNDSLYFEHNLSR